MDETASVFNNWKSKKTGNLQKTADKQPHIAKIPEC